MQTFQCVNDVTATIDPDNRIQESNETNNSRMIPSVCLTFTPTFLMAR